MRQIQNLPSTPGCRNASTCGFSARKGQCAQGFRYLPHTSGRRFRKCGVKRRSRDQTPVLPFRNLRFCWQISGYARRFPIFPRTSGNAVKTSTRKRETRQRPRTNIPLNAKTAFRRFPRTKPDVPSQGLITVETLRNNPIPVNHYPDGMTTVELNRKADLRQVKRPPYSASSSILNNALCIGIKVLHAEAKRLPIKCVIV